METLLVLEPSEVFPFVCHDNRRKRKILFKTPSGDFNVKVSSSRLVLFKQQPSCVCCGITGTKLLLQRCKGETPHINFFAVDNDGKLVLMTKDHINPSSIGGRNHSTNYQTMCANCNVLKSNAPISNEKLKQIRTAYLDLLKTGMKHRKVFHIIEEMKTELLRGERINMNDELKYLKFFWDKVNITSAERLAIEKDFEVLFNTKPPESLRINGVDTDPTGPPSTEKPQPLIPGPPKMPDVDNPKDDD